MTQNACDKKYTVAKMQNYEEITMSFKQNLHVAYNTWNKWWSDKKNQTLRNSERTPAAISKKSGIRQRTGIANIKSRTDKPCTGSAKIMTIKV